ncbi:MAG: carboxypeptidase regulatory-like domain-containing protein, partial [Sedimentisphaerales bacterium]
MVVLVCMGFVFASTYAQDQQASPAGERFMDFYAVHRQTKEPLADVTLTVRVSADNYKTRQSWDEKTDSQGLCRIKLPDLQIETLRLYPQKKGFVPLFIMWRGVPTPPELPKVFTVKMEPSTTIGGVVRNEQGEPIEGVTVGVQYQTHDPDAAENVYADVMIHEARSTDVVTDKAGRWTFDQMPAKIDKDRLRIFLVHPDYLSDSVSPGRIPLPLTRQPSIESLRDLSAVMVMKKGLGVAGKVTDTHGNPIAGAKIYNMDNYWFRSTKPFAESDAQGRFRANANPGTVTWTIQAPGYAPDLKNVIIKDGMPPIEIRLEPGHVIEGQVTDRAGKPIGGASISAEDWRKNRRRLYLTTKTNANGNFKIVDAPPDEVTFDVMKQGYMVLENYVMKPGRAGYNITLRPTLKVRGTVCDAQTGGPIDKFTAITGIDFQDGRAPQWEQFEARTFMGGQYEIEFRQETFTYRIRVDAEGYQSAMSDCIQPSEISQTEVVVDFKLDKAAALPGTVLSPDGTPLPGADVVIATDWLHITNGKIDSRSSGQHLFHRTDSSGQFPFKTPIGPYAVVVLSEQGYAEVTPDEFTATRTITVSPWGRIEGTLRIGEQPGIDKFIVFLPKSSRQREYPRIFFEYKVQTDEEGHFTFPKLPPGEGTVARAIPIDARAFRYNYHIGVEVRSGETTRVQIGGTGRPVVGKVVVPDMIKSVFDWQNTRGVLRSSSPIDPPYKLLSFTFNKDGSFRVDDVPAGEYSIRVDAYGPPPNARTPRGERIGRFSRVFSVPEMPGGRSDESLDLGELELEVIGKSTYIPSLIGKPLPDMRNLSI